MPTRPRDRFASYNGTAPIEVSSGDRKIYRLSRRGNRQLNHAIHMAAISQIRHHNSEGRAYYEKKIAEGMTGKTALRALKRKISNALYARMIDDARRLAAKDPGGHTGNDSASSAAGSHPETPALRKNHSRATGEDADRWFRAAIAHLGRTRVRAELARTHLLYGEWLRREGRRLDARAELNVGHDLFTSVGMVAFAQRAESELVATGEKRRRRIAETSEELTAQERQIAELARDGLSNTDIGARLFLSPRTVEWHLRHVYSKVGTRSRRQLASALRASDSEVAAT